MQGAVGAVEGKREHHPLREVDVVLREGRKRILVLGKEKFREGRDLFVDPLKVGVFVADRLEPRFGSVKNTAAGVVDGSQKFGEVVFGKVVMLDPPRMDCGGAPQAARGLTAERGPRIVFFR